jgi:hypothetical protein
MVQKKVKAEGPTTRTGTEEPGKTIIVLLSATSTRAAIAPK